MKHTFVSKTDLAVAYFPHISRQAARHKLMQFIRDDSHLLAELEATGYSSNNRQFSPLQVDIIFRRLGNPLSH